jgi:hypothetical protein
MQTIHKYPIDLVGEQTIEMPQDNTPLHVDTQRGVLCLWAMVNTESPTIKQKIYLLGTGHEVPSDVHLTHISTIQDGPYVWHFFKKTLMAED